MATDPGAKRSTTVRARFEAFCANQGCAPDRSLIEAFCADAGTAWSSSTRGTYRSVLRQGAPVWPVRPPGHRGATAAAPYTAGELAELWSGARAQRRSWRRHSALALLALGVGAGLSAGELAAVRGTDVDASASAVVVRGTRARSVPFTTAGAVAADLAGAVGTGYVFHPEPADRSYPNFVNNFARSLRCHPGSVAVRVARMRSSFVCGHLQAGTDLATVLAVTGICEVESLLRYCALVDRAPTTKADLRAALGAGR